MNKEQILSAVASLAQSQGFMVGCCVNFVATSVLSTILSSRTSEIRWI